MSLNSDRMRHASLTVSLSVVLLLAVASTLALMSSALAQPAAELGRWEYESKCASCHGIAGKGDGALRPFLVKAPSDLTTLARRNGGAVPEQLVWDIIDGRSAGEIGAHGSRDMPIWGREYRQEAMKQGDEARKAPEWYVRNRIVALLEYLGSLQQK